LLLRQEKKLIGPVGEQAIKLSHRAFLPAAILESNHILKVLGQSADAEEIVHYNIFPYAIEFCIRMDYCLL
jgi:hypothetical protein